jgi:hypothetical protein
VVEEMKEETWNHVDYISKELKAVLDTPYATDDLMIDSTLQTIEILEQGLESMSKEIKERRETEKTDEGYREQQNIDGFRALEDLYQEISDDIYRIERSRSANMDRMVYVGNEIENFAYQRCLTDKKLHLTQNLKNLEEGNIPDMSQSDSFDVKIKKFYDFIQ